MLVHLLMHLDDELGGGRPEPLSARFIAGAPMRRLQVTR